MKLKIESTDKKVLVEKDYDKTEEISEKKFWELYCNLINLTKVPLSKTELDLLVLIFREDPNESVFNIYNWKDLCTILDCSTYTFYTAKKKLIQKGFLKPENDEFADKDVMLNNQYSKLQKKIKELNEKKNLKSIQLNFNFLLK